MTIEEIMQGESKNVEFKVKLPKDSAKYMKTIIAFANTQGGCLVIGVDDMTRKVTGVERDSAFQVMDSIANAIADSCVPQIVPNIELQTLEGHTVIVVTVAPEPNRPYYLKSKGKENGTFIRLAGTSRPADPEKIKELELEGAHISWDELTCIGYEVTDKEIKKLWFVEAWGTGIRRIKEAAKSYGLPVPEFLCFDDMFRVNLYRSPMLEMQDDVKVSEKHRRSIGEASEKHRRSIGETAERICSRDKRNTKENFGIIV